MRTLTTCPHCRAILDDSPFCTICGRSPREEVDYSPPEPTPSAWATELGEHHVQRIVLMVVAIAAVGALAWVWLNRTGPVYVAPPLPAPVSTRPPVLTEGTSPSVEAPAEDRSQDPFGLVGDGDTAGEVVSPWEGPGGASAGGDTTGGLSPWEAPVPINPVTGQPLDEIELTAARTHVAGLLAAVPSPWALTTPQRILARDGITDLALAETIQPFAARGLDHDELATIGDVWIVAAGDDDPNGADYVDTARRHTDEWEVVDVVSPRPGIRLERVVVGDTSMWLADLTSSSLVMLLVPEGTDPGILAAFVDDWQVAVSASD